MFFVLSKTLNYLAMPFVVTCLFFLLSVLIKKPLWKKRFFWAGFVLLFFFSNDFIVNEALLAWEPEPTAYKDIHRTYEWGIVLTGVTVSEREPNDRIYFSRGADRVTHTVQLYKLGLIKKILVSGGSGRLIQIEEREADDIKKAMVLMGVKEEDVITEVDSRNTHESAVEVKKILERKGIRPADCLLITSAFHLPRSIACYRKLGMNMDTFSTDFYSHPRKFTPDILIVPKVESFFAWHKLIREWTGFVAYKLVGYV